jgi:hypothetical protein
MGRKYHSGWEEDGKEILREGVEGRKSGGRDEKMVNGRTEGKRTKEPNKGGRKSR